VTAICRRSLRAIISSSNWMMFDSFCIKCYAGNSFHIQNQVSAFSQRGSPWPETR
jgi:hypothetical protein